MSSNAVPAQFENVTAISKANVYFDGRVVSHTILLSADVKKTLGVIFPGTYKFDTSVPERMELTAGAARVKLAGASDWTTYREGDAFDVPGQSEFEIAVDEDVAQYICSYG